MNTIARQRQVNAAARTPTPTTAPCCEAASPTRCIDASCSRGWGEVRRRLFYLLQSISSAHPTLYSWHMLNIKYRGEGGVQTDQLEKYMQQGLITNAVGTHR